VTSLSGMDFFSGQGAEAFHAHRLGKQLVNETFSGLRGLVDQQDHAHLTLEILEELVRNLDNTVLQSGLEFYGVHAPPRSIRNLKPYDNTLVFLLPSFMS
jgi:hypothetical protein